jgi:phosphoserine phosphatase
LQVFAKELGIDYVHNEPEIVDGKLTGKYIGEIVKEIRRLNNTLKPLQKEGIHINQTIAVGDGANDLTINFWFRDCFFMQNLQLRKVPKLLFQVYLDLGLNLLGYHD